MTLKNKKKKQKCNSELEKERMRPVKASLNRGRGVNTEDADFK